MSKKRQNRVDVVGRSAAATPGENGIAKAVSVWVEALHDIGSLDDALTSILSLSGAARALLLRFGDQGKVARRIATVDHHPANLAAQSSSFADCLLGANRGKALPGSVWFYTDMAAEPEFRDNYVLHHWIEENKISEIILVVLGNHDLLELQFCAQLKSFETEQLKRFGGVLSPPWRRRQTGLIAKQLAHRHNHRQLLGRNLCKDDILTVSNPAKLSRCEYRVCHLLSLGLSISKISAELGVTKSTARTHLRHIYAKTGASGQMELLYFLLANSQKHTAPTSLSA